VDLNIRHLGLQAYADCLAGMKRFTSERSEDQIDELWMVQHPPVFTLGKAARMQHLLDAQGIPVLAAERGGQITYHGPGQVIAYVMLDLARRGLMVRELVHLLEQSCLDLLCAWGIAAQRRNGAPGVYLSGGQKIAALGLKVSRSRCYHGIALNVAMDLSPFQQIDPCGYPGLEVADMQSCLGYALDCEHVEKEFAARIAGSLAFHDSRQRPLR